MDPRQKLRIAPPSQPTIYTHVGLESARFKPCLSGCALALPVRVAKAPPPAPCIWRLVTELAITSGDDRYRKLLAPLARLEAILLDGLAAVTQRRDLLESLDDRYERRCTVVTSQ
jgi:hypothetical protein